MAGANVADSWWHSLETADRDRIYRWLSKSTGGGHIDYAPIEGQIELPI